MPFDWNNFLEVAERLSTQQDEASLRIAVSRAYYCIYNLAKKRAVSNGYQRKNGESSHAQMWRVYSLSPDSICKKLSTIGERLKEKRERADYEDQEYVRVDEEAKQAIADARSFIRQLDGLALRLPNPQSMRQ